MRYQSLAQDNLFFEQNWKPNLGIGIVYLVLALLAFSVPGVTTSGLSYSLAILLLANGVTRLVHAYQNRNQSGRVARYVNAVLSLAVGALIFFSPEAGMDGLAKTLAFYFLMSGAAQTFFSFAIRPVKGWAWGLIGAVVSYILGFYMLTTMPIADLKIPGALLGIDLLMAGGGMIGFSIESRFHKSVHVDSSTMRPASR